MLNLSAIRPAPIEQAAVAKARCLISDGDYDAARYWVTVAADAQAASKPGMAGFAGRDTLLRQLRTRRPLYGPLV